MSAHSHGHRDNNECPVCGCVNPRYERRHTYDPSYKLTRCNLCSAIFAQDIEEVEDVEESS